MSACWTQERCRARPQDSDISKVRRIRSARGIRSRLARERPVLVVDLGVLEDGRTACMLEAAHAPWGFVGRRGARAAVLRGSVFLRRAAALRHLGRAT